MMSGKSQLELLVLYQDMQLMINEAEEEKSSAGFNIDGIKNLESALDEIADSIDKQHLRLYNTLKTKFYRPIVPVRKDICFGCFAQLPTSYRAKIRNTRNIFTCEQCGRILFAVE